MVPVKQFGKLQITLAANPAESRVMLDGSALPVSSVYIRAGVDRLTEVELETFQLPQWEPIAIEGYLVPQEEYEAFMQSRRERR